MDNHTKKSINYNKLAVETGSQKTFACRICGKCCKHTQSSISEKSCSGVQNTELELINAKLELVKLEIKLPRCKIGDDNNAKSITNDG
jgi:hypothetical protein